MEKGSEYHSRSLVKVEHVLNEHQATTLCDRREEAVQDTSCHKRLEASGGSTPDCGGESQHQKPEQDGQTAKKGR